MGLPGSTSSAPTFPGSGGGGASGRRVIGGSSRVTYFNWIQSKVGAIRAVTPKDGEKAEEVTPQQHVRECLGIPSAVINGDTRPTLVYFHWPHDDSPSGKLSDDLCDKTLNDENVARWGTLFRCVQVDMSASDERLMTILEAGAKPSFVAVDKDAKVVARIPALGSTSKMEKALKEAFQKFPDAWKKVQEEIDRQAKWMDEAKALCKADKDVEALKLIDKVRFSRIRVGPLFDKAQADGQELGQQIDRDKTK